MFERMKGRMKILIGLDRLDLVPFDEITNPPMCPEVGKSKAMTGASSEVSTLGRFCG